MPNEHMLFEREQQDMTRIVGVIFEGKNTSVAGGSFPFKTIDDQGEDYIIMMPTMISEVYLGEVSPARVLVVEPGVCRIVDGVDYLAHEINIHKVMYKANPTTKAVLYTHTPNAILWAATGLPMPNLTETTAKVKEIPVMDLGPSYSEELAKLTSDYVKEQHLELPHILLLSFHDVLINTDGESGIETIHKALQVLNTVEWNTEIAYKRAIFRALEVTGGFYSKGEKIGELEGSKHKTAIYDKSVIAAGGD